jgi:hypothetical protein
MTYSIDDITELVRYHLVVCAADDATADRNLDALARNVEQMTTTRTPHHFYEWVTCDGCGASVGPELVDPDGAGWAADGSFECSSCRFAGEEV